MPYAIKGWLIYAYLFRIRIHIGLKNTQLPNSLLIKWDILNT